MSAGDKFIAEIRYESEAGKAQRVEDFLKLLIRAAAEASQTGSEVISDVYVCGVRVVLRP